MKKKVSKIACLIGILFIIISLFLPWRTNFVSGGTLSGWSYLFHFPILWVVCVLFLFGAIGFLFFKEKRYGIFAICLGVVNLYLLWKDIQIMPKNANVFQYGFKLSIFSIAFEVSAILFVLFFGKKTKI